MKSRLLFLFAIPAMFLLDACTSGKAAYQRGDYYDAVLESVQRLRQSPDNKKSKEILTLSYQAAIDFINTDAQNQIASNANMKWKSVVQDYDKINNLYNDIKTCPGALKVIPNPISKFDELKDAKKNAAEECYNAGVQSMLKNTREDAKQAFFLFTDANNFSPGYQEAIEMIQQSKFNATLKVIVEPGTQNYSNWNFDPVVYGTNVNQFVKFYSPQQAEEAKLTRIDQTVKLNINGFQESRPTVGKTNQDYTDSVSVGEKTVNNQKVQVKRAIVGHMTIYEKQVATSGSVQLIIQDASNNAEISNSNIVSQLGWSDRWAYCSGDTRAIPQGVKNLCNKPEPQPNSGQLIIQTKRDLDTKLAGALRNFYKNY